MGYANELGIPEVIDLEDPNNISSKVVDEKTSRKKWLAWARREGYEREMLMTFAKYDRLLRLCTNEKERKDIAKLGVMEIYTIMGRGGKLYVDGELVYSEKK